MRRALLTAALGIAFVSCLGVDAIKQACLNDPACNADLDGGALRDGGADGASSTGDGGLDAGSHREFPDGGWYQARDGFSTLSGPCAGCSLSVDPASGNLVSASISSGFAGLDQQEAIADGGLFDDVLAHGHLHGRLFIGALQTAGNSSFCVFMSSHGPLLDMFVTGKGDGTGQLGIYTDPGILQTQAVFASGWLPVTQSSDVTFDVRWEAGKRRLIYANGTLLEDQTLAAFTPPALSPSALRLGIDHYDGTDGGWSVELSDWWFRTDEDGGI